MTFRKQYEAALTIKNVVTPESIPNAAYFAGSFYDLLDSTAGLLPTVLCGGSVEIGESLLLSFKPMDCHMLLYTSENEYNRRAGEELIRNRVQMAEILGTDAIVL